MAIGELQRVRTRVSPGRSRALVVGAGALLAAAAYALPPIPDETYYWAWSRSPSLSYLDHPPGVAWVIRAFSALFGRGLFGLRIATLLSMAIVLLGAALGARRLAAAGRGRDARDGDRAAEWALVLLFGAPMFAIGYLPATPDPFQGALTGLAAYLVIRAFEDEATPWWSFLAAFVLVASVIVKHSSGVIALGVLGGALLVPEGRRRLARFHPWAGVALGLLFLAPWLIADLTREGSSGSIAFQLGRVSTRGAGRGLLALPLFAGALMIALGPLTGLLLPIFSARAIAERRSPAKVVLGAGALALLAACLPSVVLGGGELNWAMPAMVFALPAFAAELVSGDRRFARAIELGALSSAAVVLALLVHVIHPYLPIPARSDTTLRGAGFADLAEEVRRTADRYGAHAILTRRYQLASLLRFHLDDQIAVIEVGSPRRSQYDLWAKPALCRGEAAVVLLLGGELPEAIAPLFQPIDGASTVEVKRRSGDQVLESYFLSAVHATGDLFQPDARCAMRRAADVARRGASGDTTRGEGGPT